MAFGKKEELLQQVLGELERKKKPKEGKWKRMVKEREREVARLKGEVDKQKGQVEEYRAKIEDMVRKGNAASAAKATGVSNNNGDAENKKMKADMGEKENKIKELNTMIQ